MKNKFLKPVLLSLVLILAVAVISAACAAPTPSPKPTTTIPTPTPSPTTLSPKPAPTIKITAPSGNIFQIGPVKVSVEVANFTLVDKLGASNVPGEGHIHYFLDVDAPTEPGKPAVTAQGTYAATSATSYTWPNVGGGSRKFSAELVNNDHAPLSPPVVASVTVLVIPEIGPPSVVITSPRDGASLPPGDVTVSVQVSNFNIVSKLGAANAPREGHIHYFLDVDAPTIPGKPAVTAQGTYAATAESSYKWANVSSGGHTFSVELVNNDHTPLDPPVIAKVVITATGSPPTTTTPAPTAANVTIDLTAQNIAFDKSSISVPAGANVTINFNNKDSLPHNFSVYTNTSPATVVFQGQVITGPAVRVYTFTAPKAPGNYFFQCDVHTNMTGSFIVTPN